MSPALRIATCAFGACAAAWLGVLLFNRIPANWLCDYDEQPGEDLLGVRLRVRPHGVVMALLLTLSFLGISIQYDGKPLYIAAGCFIAVTLLLISVSDFKYCIIPDQFLLALFVTASAFSVYDIAGSGKLLHSSWLSPVLGAAAGAGLMLAIGLLGRLLFQKEALGFGDVKLFAAAGVAAGFPGIFPVFLIAIFSAFFYIVYLILNRKDIKNVFIPFGPFLCLALLLFLMFHSQINSFADWYLSLLMI